MILDSQTNFLYLADSLPKEYLAFHERLLAVINRQKIPYSLLPATKDVWAVDYMPIQVSAHKFIKFVYYPDYLKKYAKWRATISDTLLICKSLDVPIICSDIVLDGGNVVKGKDKIIICDKLFRENPNYSEKQLVTKLEALFEVDKIIFIPTDPIDDIGHADGIVRFIEDDTVLINTYSNGDNAFGRSVRLSLHNAGLHFIEIPYNPYQNKSNLQANGNYINYLEMSQAIILPTYGIKDDETCIRLFEQLFHGQVLATVESNDIASEGGVLNCISWNILRK